MDEFNPDIIDEKPAVAGPTAIPPQKTYMTNAPGGFPLPEAKATAVGVLKGATYGYLDKIAARVMSLSPSISYEEAKQVAKHEIDSAINAAPENATMGEIVGSVLTGGTFGKLLSGTGKAVSGAFRGISGIEKGAEVASKAAAAKSAGILKGAATGATEGAVAGYGYDEEGGLGKGALVGAGLGTLGGLANAKMWKNKAGGKAATLFTPISKDSEMVLEKIPATAEDVGEYLVKKGAIQSGSNAKTVYKEADILQKEVGRQTEALMSQKGSKQVVDGLQLQEQIKNSEWYQKLANSQLPEAQKVLSQLEKKVDAIPTNMTLYQAHKLKQDMYKFSNPNIYNNPFQKLTAEKISKNVTSELNAFIKDNLGAMDEGALKQYEELNDQFQKLQVAKEGAYAKGYGRDNMGGPLVERGDIPGAVAFSKPYIAGKAIEKGVEKTGLVQGTRNRQALLYYSIGHNMERLPESARAVLQAVGKRGQNAFMAAHDSLMKGDPEYKQAVDGIMNDSFDPDIKDEEFNPDVIK